MSRRKPFRPPAPPLSPLPPPDAALPRAWRCVAVMVVCASVALSVGHLLVTPVARLDPARPENYINAPDEAAHLEYVRALSVGHRVPTRDDATFRTYEWHQPPLYYALASVVYPLGPRAVRGLSLGIGLVGLLLVYRAARRILADDPVLAVLALGLAALLPMRQALTAAAGNDGLTEVFFSLTLLLLIEAYRSGFTERRAAGLGAVLAAALLTKASGLLLVPLVVFALVLLWREGEAPASLGRGALWTLGVAALLTAPWYARNIALYHEFTPVRAFVHEFQGTAKASDWIGRQSASVDWSSGDLRPAEPMSREGYLALVANWTFRTFCASYTPPGPAARIGRPVFLPPPFYLPFVAIGLVAAGGLLAAHFARSRLTSLQVRLVYVLFAAALLVLASFGAFVWTFFQAQGRYLYPALMPLCVLTALGVRAAVPQRYRDAASGLTLGLLLVLDLAFLVAAVIPAYAS